MNKAVKQLCTSGAFSVFMELADEILGEFKEISFNPNPYEMARGYGKKEGAEAFLSRLEDRIKEIAKQ